jgi:hypothetical protein
MTQKEMDEIPSLTHENAHPLYDPTAFRGRFDRGYKSRDWEKRSACDGAFTFTSNDLADKRAAALWHKPLLQIWNDDSAQEHPWTNRQIAFDGKSRVFHDPNVWVFFSSALREQHQDLAEYPFGHRERPPFEPVSNPPWIDGHRWKSPFIPVSTSPSWIAYQAAREKQLILETKPAKPPRQYLILTDPRVRLREGLPIINFDEEATYFDLARELWGYTRHESTWLCLYQVTRAEIVWIWRWDDLKDDVHWYENTVKPALRTFQDTGRRPGPIPRHPFKESYDPTSLTRAYHNHSAAQIVKGSMKQVADSATDHIRKGLGVKNRHGH